MSRINDRRHIAVLLSSLLSVCLTLLPATASATEAQFVSSMDTAPNALKAAPMLSDCTPCALCYLATAPEAPNGFDKKHPTSTASLWIVPNRLVAYATLFHTGGGYNRLPVRIVYCRWLN